METFKKNIVWIIIGITVIYSSIIKYLQPNELHIYEVIGYSLGILLAPLFLSLLMGLYKVVRGEKFMGSWVKKTFVYSWLFIVVLNVFFSPSFGLFAKKEGDIKFKNLLKQQVTEINILRREYHNKLAVIGITDFTKREEIKDTEFLKKLLDNITKSKEIEDWHYQTNLSLTNKWYNIYENLQKENDNTATRNLVENITVGINNEQKVNEEMRLIQNDFYLKYFAYVNFLITENNNIILMSNGVALRDKNKLNTYNTLQVDFNNASKLYVDLYTKRQEELSNKVNVINKNTVKLSGIDSLINMVKYRNY